MSVVASCPGLGRLSTSTDFDLKTCDEKTCASSLNLYFSISQILQKPVLPEATLDQ